MASMLCLPPGLSLPMACPNRLPLTEVKLLYLKSELHQDLFLLKKDQEESNKDYHGKNYHYKGDHNKDNHGQWT